MKHTDTSLRALLMERLDIDPPTNLVPTAHEIGTSFRQRRRRRARLLAVGGSALAVIAAVSVPVAIREDGSHSAASDHGGANIGVINASQLFAPGTMIAGSGRVVSVPGHPTRLCAPGPDAQPLTATGQQPAPQYCAVGIDVTGVDLARLTSPRRKDGAVEGYAWLQGTYTVSGLNVLLQQAPRDPAPDLPPDWTHPPCSEPAGGWASDPTKAQDLLNAAAAYQTAHPGQIASTTLFHPTGGAVAVVAATDLSTVRQALHGDPHALCVVPTRFTATQLTQAQAAIAALGSADGSAVLAAGPENDATGQAHIQASVVAVTPTLAQLQQRFPTSLVQYTPWLTSQPN